MIHLTLCYRQIFKCLSVPSDGDAVVLEQLGEKLSFVQHLYVLDSTTIHYRQ